MNSEINTDIFYKTSNKDKTKSDDFFISSSLFTSSTPNKQAINEITESAYLNKKLMKIHERVLDSEFLPIGNISKSPKTAANIIESDSVINNSSITQSQQSVQSGGNKYNKYTTETNEIPINYSESTMSIPPYIYDGKYLYSQSEISRSRYKTPSSSPKEKETKKSSEDNYKDSKDTYKDNYKDSYKEQEKKVSARSGSKKGGSKKVNQKKKKSNRRISKKQSKKQSKNRSRK